MHLDRSNGIRHYREAAGRSLSHPLRQIQYERELAQAGLSQEFQSLTIPLHQRPLDRVLVTFLLFVPFSSAKCSLLAAALKRMCRTVTIAG